jgi:hypothetical protein
VRDARSRGMNVGGKKQSERSKTSSLERVGRTGGGYLRNVKMVERMGKGRRRGREPMQETSEGPALAASVRTGDAAQSQAISQSPSPTPTPTPTPTSATGASAFSPRPGHPTALKLAAVALRRPDCRTARALTQSTAPPTSISSTRALSTRYLGSRPGGAVYAPPV